MSLVVGVLFASIDFDLQCYKRRCTCKALVKGSISPFLGAEKFGTMLQVFMCACGAQWTLPRTVPWT